MTNEEKLKAREIIELIRNGINIRFNLLDAEREEKEDRQQSSFVEEGKLGEIATDPNYASNTRYLTKIMRELNEYELGLIQKMSANLNLEYHNVRNAIKNDMIEYQLRLMEFDRQKDNQSVN